MSSEEQPFADELEQLVDLVESDDWTEITPDAAAATVEETPAPHDAALVDEYVPRSRRDVAEPEK